MRYVLFPLLFICNVCFGQSIDLLWKRYQNGDLKYVLEQALQSSEKETVEMQLLIGRALTDSQEYNKAIPHLKNVLAAGQSVKHQRAWAEAYLGVCMFANGELKLSRMLLSKCIADNITLNCSKFASKRMLLFGFTEHYEGFNRQASDHFIFHFEPTVGNNIDLGVYVNRREQAYDAISKFFGSKLEGKINYFSWASKSSLKSGTGRSSGFAAPEYGIVHATIDQTAGHEIAHLFVQSKRKSALINEGLAVYLDQEHSELFSAAKQLMKKHGTPEIDVQQMWNMETEYDSRVFYTVAGAFVEELLRKGGKDKLLRLIEDQTIENAEKIYGSTFSEIVKDFERNMNGLPRKPTNLN